MATTAQSRVTTANPATRATIPRTSTATGLRPARLVAGAIAAGGEVRSIGAKTTRGRVLLASPAVGRRPNFFILGAPKCGTTALSEYLRDHPRAFLSQPKEPHYFCGDFDYYYAPGQRTEAHYLHLFEAATDDHLAVGEGVGLVPLLVRRGAQHRGLRPGGEGHRDARNPVDLVPSLHSQLLYMLDEDEPDLARAWELQEARSRGERLPPRVRVPEFLQYGEAARLAAQLRRVYEVLPREQVLTLVFDDMRDDTARCTG